MVSRIQAETEGDNEARNGRRKQKDVKVGFASRTEGLGEQETKSKIQLGLCDVGP